MNRVLRAAVACVSLVSVWANTPNTLASLHLRVLTPPPGVSRLGADRTHAWKHATAVTIFGLRKFPYPYDSMLAISSDADHETLRKFELVHEFINTTATTPMGKGLGLDFADSVFMYNGSNLPGPIDQNNTPLRDELTYFRGISAQPFEANRLKRYMLAGWIDTLHSFGDFSRVNGKQSLFNQSLAVRALHTLQSDGVHLTVWTDHGNTSNVDNFGAYGSAPLFWYQHGALPDSKDNVVKLLVKYGVRFVWADLPSDQFGYYNIVYPKKLQDGTKVWGFWRYTNSGFTASGQPEWVWTADALDRELTIGHLLQLENLHQYAIVAQHLEADNGPLPLARNSVEALQLLARQYHEGHILVTRTSRLLQYNVTQLYVRYHVTYSSHRAVIHITGVDDPVFGPHFPSLDEIRGVTFYASNPRAVTIDVGNVPVNSSLVQRNPSDGVHPSIGIRWFSPDTTNYVIHPFRPVYGPIALAPLTRHEQQGHMSHGFINWLKKWF